MSCLVRAVRRAAPSVPGLVLFCVLCGCARAGVDVPGAVLLVRDDRLRVNQIGFQPGQLKLVLLAAGPEIDAGAAGPEIDAGARDLRFHVVRAEQPAQPVYTGTFTDCGLDPDSGERVLRGDFTALRTPGRYQILLPRRALSAPFRIAADASRQALTLAARWFYLQRSGAPKDDPVTGLRHGADYTAPSPPRAAVGPDGRIAAGAPRVDVRGGWWDAGDFGRYVPPAATTILSLLYAYRFNPGAFADGALAIPESGNGVPDLLDEIRWELDWLLKMQRADGAVHHKAATQAYADGMADRDPRPALLYEISTQATAQLAGALAEASTVYRPLDPAYADRLLRAAERAWEFLSGHPDKLPPGGFRNPDDPNGGDYSVKDADEGEHRLWAAAALLAATGQARYAAAFHAHWQRRVARPVYGLGWPGGYAFGMFAYLRSAAGDPAVKAQLRAVVATQAEAILGVVGRTAYRVALTGREPPFGYDWGSVGTLLNHATYLLLAYEQRPDARLVDGAAAQLGWVLGANPLGQVFFTGLGEQRIRAPHHRPSQFLGAALPGAVGEGPNAMSSGGDPVLQRLFAEDRPPALRYADDAGSWATNEPTIYYNAAFVAVAAWFTRAEAK